MLFASLFALEPLQLDRLKALKDSLGTLTELGKFTDQCQNFLQRTRMTTLRQLLD